MNHFPLRRAPRILLLSGCAVVAAVAIAACSGSSGKAASHSGSPTAAGGSAAPAYYGALVTPPPPKPDVTLTDTSGRPYSLRDATKGSLTLLYMGYTNCPDECPTFMAQLGTVMSSLSPDVRDKVKVVFITTDPDRDTPAVLRSWLDQFDSSFIGLTGSEDTIANLSTEMGLPPPEKEETAGGYGVTHATLVWAFDKNDNLAHTVYPEGFTDDQLAHDISKLAAEGWRQ